MRRSKLEIYLKVLEVLDVHGPLGVTKITLRARINYEPLKPILNTLKEKALIDEKTIKNQIVLAINAKGKRILNQLAQYGKTGKHTRKQQTREINNTLIKA